MGQLDAVVIITPLLPHTQPIKKARQTEHINLPNYHFDYGSLLKIYNFLSFKHNFSTLLIRATLYTYIEIA